MYHQIGEKIKSMAKVIGYIGIALGVIEFLMVAMFALRIENVGYRLEWILIALILGGITALITWISTWTLYGFGSLVSASEEQTAQLKLNRQAIFEIGNKVNMLYKLVETSVQK